MNKNKALFIFFISIALLFAACDNSYDYHFQVSNNSSDLVRVNIYDKTGSTIPTRVETVNKGETKTILIINGGLCGNSCNAPSISENDFPILVPRIVIMQHDTLKANRKSQNMNNWLYQSKKELGIYTLYIANRDFKP